MVYSLLLGSQNVDWIESPESFKIRDILSAFISDLVRIQQH